MYKANIASACVEFTTWREKDAKGKITNRYKTASHAKSNEEIVPDAERKHREEQFLDGMGCVQARHL